MGHCEANFAYLLEEIIGKIEVFLSYSSLHSLSRVRAYKACRASQLTVKVKVLIAEQQWLNLIARLLTLSCVCDSHLEPLISHY